MLDRIEQDTIQLDSMLEQILTVARLESGQIKPKFEPLSLSELVDDVLHDAKFEAAGKNVAIGYEGVENVQVNGDPGMLRSAVENVVRNAIFYSGQGGRIEVKLTTDRGNARLSIRDNGPGVPPDKLLYIFEPFYRVDDSRGSATGGMGLGLAIVQNAISAHPGASIAAENLEPHGFEIKFKFPMIDGSPAPSSPEARRVVETASKTE